MKTSARDAALPCARDAPPRQPCARKGRHAPKLPYDLVFEATLVPTERLRARATPHGAEPGQPHDLPHRSGASPRTCAATASSTVEGAGRDLAAAAHRRLAPLRLPRRPAAQRLRLRRAHLRAVGDLPRRRPRSCPRASGRKSGSFSRSTLRLRVPEGWSIAVPYERSADGSYRGRERAPPLRPADGVDGARPLGVLREKRRRRARRGGGPVPAEAPAPGHPRAHALDAAEPAERARRAARSGSSSSAPAIRCGAAGCPGRAQSFIHAERPLITPDGTSPLAPRAVPRRHRRARGVGRRLGGRGPRRALLGRAARALAHHQPAPLRARAGERSPRAAPTRRCSGRRSEGASTARAVSVLRELDAELRARTEQQKNLDDVVAELVAQARRRSRPRRSRRPPSRSRASTSTPSSRAA